MEYTEKLIRFITNFNENGQLVEKGYGFAATGGSPLPVHGKWKIKKGKLCFMFSDSIKHQGKTMCRKVVRKSGGSYELITGKGKVMRTWKKVLPGNPYNLE